MADDNKTAAGTTTGDGGKTETPAAGGQQQQTPKAQVQTPKETPAGGGERKAVRLAGNDDIPEDADLLELSRSALDSRLRRHTSAELKKRFGTDDPDTIKAKLDKLAQMEADEEKRKQQEMSEVEREKDLRAKAEARAAQAEARARAVAEDRVFEKQDTFLSRVAGKHIDEDYIEAELQRFAKHLRQEYPGKDGQKQLDKMTPKQIETMAGKFFEERVKAKPRLSKGYEMTLREQIEKEVKEGQKAKAKVPITTGAKEGKPPEKSDDAAGQPKTFAPGKPNSYTDAEAKAKMRELGVRY